MEKSRSKVASKKKFVESQGEGQLDFRQTLERVRQAANGGNAQAQRSIRACVTNSPNICAEFGNATKYIERELIKEISGGEILASAAITQQVATMRHELAGVAPTRLELMAVERIVITWLQLQHTEMQFLQSQKDIGWAKYWLRRLEVADKLHRAAIGSLMLIRDLLPPPVPANAHPVVDVQTEDVKSKASETIAPDDTDEIFVGNGSGINRIAKLLARNGDSRSFFVNGEADEPRKLNGHHKQLDALLVNGTNGHTGNGDTK